MGNFGDARSRPNEAPMPEPLAFFLTWTTYGTWLPGDERNWVREGKGIQLPRPVLKKFVIERMTESPCLLSLEQRNVVEDTISRLASARGQLQNESRTRRGDGQLQAGHRTIAIQGVVYEEAQGATIFPAATDPRELVDRGGGE